MDTVRKLSVNTTDPTSDREEEEVDVGNHTQLLWSCDLSYPIPNNYYLDSTTQVQDMETSCDHSQEIRTQIKSSTAAMKIFSEISTKASLRTSTRPSEYNEKDVNNSVDNGNSILINHSSDLSQVAVFSLSSWDAISRAIDNQLMLMYIQTISSRMDSSLGAVIEIHLNVSMAYKFCSPLVLERIMPLRMIRLPKSNMTKKNPRFYALILLEALAEIYHDSLIRDVADSVFHKNTTTGNTDSINFAHEIYNRIDNMHSDELLRHSPPGEDEISATRPRIQGLQIEGLVPTLRPYQEAAVRWMIQREQMNAESLYQNNHEWEVFWMVFSPSIYNGVHFLPRAKARNTCMTVSPLYKQMKKTNRSDKSILLYCPYGGWLARSYKEAKEFSLNMVETSNTMNGGFGILAESMGLGKTVETLACILSNKCPTEEENTSSSQLVGNQQKTQSKCLENISGERDSSLRCYCGEGIDGNKFWIWCEKCCGPMHTKCANFDTVEAAIKSCFPVFDDNHRRTLFCDFNRCPFCHDTKVKSRATLIITPSAILSQWQREISRHTNGSIKTIIYDGVKRYIHPLTLADHDVVLTTFDTLMAELSHSFENPYVHCADAIHDGKCAALEKGTRSLRTRKRYRVVPSPLIRIRWWRMILDEAQRVETPTALSSKMALQINTVHRWCVTGTPISRGRLDDLYGLLLFIGLAPFYEKTFYTACLKYCHRGCLDRLSHMLQNILWRSTTSNSLVRQQLGLPDQEEIIRNLKFSSIEKHFYQRQLETTILAASSLENNGSKNSHRKRPAAKDNNQGISLELRRLRAACCHPQVGSFGIRTARDSRDTVLCMSQILSRLIDEAKSKAEEAQRITVLHLIALANLNRLKGEIKKDVSFLSTSCKLYSQAVTMGEKNSSTIIVDSDVIFAGSDGFEHTSVSQDVISLQWKHQPAIAATMVDQSVAYIENQRFVWCSFEFKTPKRISGLLAKPFTSPQTINETESFLQPKEIVLEASNGALNGMFIECVKGIVSSEVIDCRTLKSKRWRLRISSFEGPPTSMFTFGTGLELRITELDLEVDELQRLHIYHNLNELLKTFPEAMGDMQLLPNMDMNTQAQKIEQKYLESARAAHAVCKSNILSKMQSRLEIVSDLGKLNPTKILSNMKISWWQEIIYSFRHNERDKGNFLGHIIDRLNDLNTYAHQTNRTTKFPNFSTIDGLFMALTSRLADSAMFQYHDPCYTGPDCINKVLQISINPSEAEIIENSLCHNCRQDWGQTGPTCSHCKLERELNDLHDALNDAELLCVLKSLYDWSRNHMGSGTKTQSLVEEAEKFFEFLSSSQKELEAAKLFWKSHFNLLSDIDEINICKRRPVIDDNRSILSITEQAFVVRSQDIDYLINDHGAKQAMAEVHLRRHLDTVRYLKSLHHTTDDEASCSICLTSFDDSERAVLRCGHSFHISPCLEALLTRSGGKIISCPMRCTERTKREDILTASNKRIDDGSRLGRTIVGRWGTKVDQLVNDLLSLTERSSAVKSIIFSQWDDMLDVVEKALLANSLSFIRPASKKKFGSEISRFQSSPSSSSLLMNVKQGAEGLNLTEAKHIFILEPMMNHSLDQQALSRVHRIGQTEKTFVHRYLIKETIEEKINRIRIFRQVHEQDEASRRRSDYMISAGGVDGGFDVDELKDLLS